MGGRGYAGRRGGGYGRGCAGERSCGGAARCAIPRALDRAARGQHPRGALLLGVLLLVGVAVTGVMRDRLRRAGTSMVTGARMHGGLLRKGDLPLELEQNSTEGDTAQ